MHRVMSSSTRGAGKTSEGRKRQNDREHQILGKPQPKTQKQSPGRRMARPEAGSCATEHKGPNCSRKEQHPLALLTRRLSRSRVVVEEEAESEKSAWVTADKSSRSGLWA